ncbi:MAG: hypothetical protein ACC628_22140, partial [Pirellulaceae bacterium]
TIFGDIDPDESTRVFEYGRENGKPHFIAGPNDAPFRCRQILDTLKRVCGPGGYDCTILHSGTSHQINDVLRIESNGDV